MTEECRNIRETILRVSRQSGHGHLGSCFSVVELLFGIYSHIRHKPSDPKWENRDLFFLSKGHASLAQYAVLAHFGYFPEEEIYSFGAFQSRFGCHPDRLKIPGIEASTGSLGHGIGIALGAALGAQIKQTEQKIFVLIGDGEANEGSVWEACLLAADRDLSNLTVILDYNMSQGRALQITDPASKLSAFGFSVSEINGHKLGEIKHALMQNSDKPKAVVAHTVKGYGSNTMTENPFVWHRKSPSEEELIKLLTEIQGFKDNT